MSASVATVEGLAERATTLWLQVASAGSRPSSVETLKPAHRKSAVLRLVGAGPNGRSIVAKRATRGSIELEARAYQRVLSRLAVSVPRFHGAIADGALSWLFVEDAGDTRFNPALASHRRLAGSWMARAHGEAGPLAQVAELPERGPDHYRALRRSVDALLREALANPALSGAEAVIVKEASERVAAIGSSWSAVESRFERCPRTLVLGGFGSKNARVLESSEGPVLLPFDFESAGYGCPAIDLVYVDGDAYAQEACAWWPGLDVAEVDRLRGLGRLLRVLKAIPGERRVLLGTSPSKTVAKLRWYRGELEATVA
jgi:Phosphotransferase enzyme family